MNRERGRCTAEKEKEQNVMLQMLVNERLCRVGPGTPGGELFRSVWLPALLAKQLPEPGCSPVRLRLLGEDLVAYRDGSRGGASCGW